MVAVNVLVSASVGAMENHVPLPASASPSGHVLALTQAYRARHPRPVSSYPGTFESRYPSIRQAAAPAFRFLESKVKQIVGDQGLLLVHIQFQGFFMKSETGGIKSATYWTILMVAAFETRISLFSFLCEKRSRLQTSDVYPTPKA